MKMLSPQEIKELRTEIAGLGLSDGRIDEIISILDAIATSFVDQAFGLSSTQLSLSARANHAFNGAENRVNLQNSETSELVDLDIEGAINTLRPMRHLAP